MVEGRIFSAEAQGWARPTARGIRIKAGCCRLSPRDWVPDDDLVFFVLDVVKDLDISVIQRKDEAEKRGFPPFHPRMMTTLLLYSYTQGAFSSRRIMKRCERVTRPRG